MDRNCEADDHALLLSTLGELSSRLADNFNLKRRNAELERLLAQAEAREQQSSNSSSSVADREINAILETKALTEMQGILSVKEKELNGVRSENEAFRLEKDKTLLEHGVSIKSLRVELNVKEKELNGVRSENEAFRLEKDKTLLEHGVSINSLRVQLDSKEGELKRLRYENLALEQEKGKISLDHSTEMGHMHATISKQKQEHTFLLDQVASLKESIKLSDETTKSLQENSESELEGLRVEMRRREKENLEKMESSISAHRDEIQVLETRATSCESLNSKLRLELAQTRTALRTATSSVQTTTSNNSVSVHVQTSPSSLAARHTKGSPDDDIIIIERPASSPYKSPLSKQRNADLARFPIVVDIPEYGKNMKYFSHPTLSKALGGGRQNVIVRVGNHAAAKPLAEQRKVHAYLCPNLNHNPWLPYAPGQHGYMFVGLGEEEGSFSQPEDLPVFIGVSPAKYFYAGHYKVMAVEPLHKDEWNSLPEKVKSVYSARTYTKRNKQPDKQRKGGLSKDSLNDCTTEEQIRIAYDEGRLSAPCVRLSCLSFDKELYEGLVSFAGGRAIQQDNVQQDSKEQECHNDSETDNDSSDDYVEKPYSLTASIGSSLPLKRKGDAPANLPRKSARLSGTTG